MIISVIIYYGKEGLSMKKRIGALLVVALMMSSMPVHADAADMNYQSGGYYYTKSVISNTTSYGSKTRVSDDIVVPPKGGTITCSIQKEFSAVISGNISGIQVNTSGKLTTKVGYSLNGTPGKTQYMAYRVKYADENGIRYKRALSSGKIVAQNNYSVKRPISGVYSLVTVR